MIIIEDAKNEDKTCLICDGYGRVEEFYVVGYTDEDDPIFTSEYIECYNCKGTKKEKLK